jgi:hypothetical protein
LCSHFHILPLMSVLDLLQANWGWLVVALIVILGLFVSGGRDLIRFSLGRAWAISSVCFDESIRKRVLWIAPLAIVGVIGVTQFQRALDEQDAVRQSLKVCLFATALVVILASIILACTNLPKEIESRVIYTIVTKPITRLELVLGKVIGFARVALAIVLIMGAFTWVYMRFSAHQKRQQIAYRLQEGDVSDTERGRLIEYQHTGLLTAREFWAPDELGMYGAPPNPNSSIRVISNQGDQDVAAAFRADRKILFGPPTGDAEDWAHQGIGQNGLVIRVAVNTHRTGKPDDQPQSGEVYGPTMGPARAPIHLVPPRMSVAVMDEHFNSMFTGAQMLGGATPAELVGNIVQYSKNPKIDPPQSAAFRHLGEPSKDPDGGSAQYLYAWLPPESAGALFTHPAFYIRLVGGSANVDYLIGPHPVDCFVPDIGPNGIDIDGPRATRINAIANPDGPGEFLMFRGRMGIHYDQEMGGGSDAPQATAVFSFRDTPPPSLQAPDQIPFQINVSVERSNSDVESGHEDATSLAVRVIDVATKKVTPLPNPVMVESRLPAYFTIPAEAVTSGNFDVIFHSRNNEETIGLMPDSLQLVISHQPFELNLLKSLSIIWMMSILVIILAVLCSTFVSWPIAVVLTVLLLLGHWGVDQLADVSGPGLGRQIVNDFKFTDVPLANLVSTGVDTLSKILNGVSHALPDTSKFDAIGDIEQGVSISSDRLLEALTVLGGFGIPALVVAYVLLRNKEVAP